jgi:ribulose-phosphate 3-epimerase
VNQKTKISCSVISCDPQEFISNIEILSNSGIDSFHFDVMDGLFVPRFGLYPEFLSMLRERSLLPINVHMMITDPDDHIEIFANSGATTLTPHLETLTHPIMTLMRIKEHGLSAGIAINPGTPLYHLEPLLDYVDSVTLMAINPGIVGHKLIANIFSRIEKLHALVKKFSRDIQIEVDGGVTFENLSKLSHSGVDGLVCGAGTIFHPKQGLMENISQMHGLMDFAN